MHANTPQNATKRDQAKHPWASAHGSPDQRPPLANGRSTHKTPGRAGHGSARVCAPQTPQARKHAAKTQPIATRPGTRGLPPTARPINARRSPMAAQHTHHPGEPGTEVPGCAPPKRRMHADTTQKRNRTQPGQAPVGSRPRLANQRPPLANGRSTHTPPRRAGHGSARVPSPTAACTPTHRKTRPNATTPGTRGLPPTARLINAEHSPPQATLRPPQASRARKCPGASQTAACTQKRRKNATERHRCAAPVGFRPRLAK